MDVSASRLSRNERPGTGSNDVSAHGGRSADLTSARTGTPRLTCIVFLILFPCRIFTIVNILQGKPITNILHGNRSRSFMRVCVPYVLKIQRHQGCECPTTCAIITRNKHNPNGSALHRLMVSFIFHRECLALSIMHTEGASCVHAEIFSAMPAGGRQWSYDAQRPGAEQVDDKSRDGLLEGTTLCPPLQLFSQYVAHLFVLILLLAVAGVYLRDAVLRVPKGMPVLSKSLGKGMPYLWERSEIKVPPSWQCQS